MPDTKRRIMVGSSSRVDIEVPIAPLDLAPLLAFPLAAPAQETEPSLRTTVNEVMLDVVVRDKKAHIIRDLRPDEVKVFEDGVPQTLRHFEFFAGHLMPTTTAQQAPTAPASAPPARMSRPPNNVQELRDISVVSVVVANLDQQGRKVTLDTMRDFVKTQLRPNSYVGVFWLSRAVFARSSLTPTMQEKFPMR